MERGENMLAPRKRPKRLIVDLPDRNSCRDTCMEERRIRAMGAKLKRAVLVFLIGMVVGA